MSIRGLETTLVKARASGGGSSSRFRRGPTAIATKEVIFAAVRIDSRRGAIGVPGKIRVEIGDGRPKVHTFARRGVRFRMVFVAGRVHAESILLHMQG